MKTVKATRDFLDTELRKYESWDDVEKYPNNLIKVLFTNTKGDWKKAKKDGVGKPTIANSMKRTRISLSRFDVVYSPAVHNRGVELGHTPDVGVYFFISASYIVFMGWSENISKYVHACTSWDTVGMIICTEPRTLYYQLKKQYKPKSIQQ